MFCASQAATALSKASNSRCTNPGNCFISGTLVLTSMGNKPIEEIEIGDEVWAYNEETGEKSLKKVVDLLRNKIKKWIHLLFELEDGKTEEIVCTEGHPFYVNNIGWVKSIDLLENDSILMYNYCSATLKQKDIEELEVEEVTYNFEVEDFHTYYVGENSVLVHNICTKANTKNYSAKEISKQYNISVEDFHQKVKPEILKLCKPNKMIGNNPDILLTKTG